MATVNEIITNLNRRGMPDSYNTYALKWVDQAEELLWNAYDWDLKLKRTTKTLTAASGTYAVTGIATDIEDIPYMYDTSHDIKLLPKKMWEILEADPDLSLGGNAKYFYFDNQGVDISFWPKPDSGYDLNIPYWVQRTPLTSVVDTPAFPSRYHTLIEDGAWAYYLMYEFGENDTRAIMAFNVFKYGDPNWVRGRKITGGFMGAIIRENRYLNQGHSQDASATQVF